MNRRSNPIPAVAAPLTSAASWLAPLMAGAVLRLWNLHRQILLDDEMHTVATALYTPVREILATFKSEDPCLPLTAFYRLLLEAGVPFSEMTFRVPVLLVSLAAIVALPRLALPFVGRGAAIVFAWLLAISPVLAIYSGMVRPYGVVSLLGPLATLLVLRFREDGRLEWGIGYAVVAALCMWFHLGTAPLAAAPFGLLLLERASPVGRRRGAPAWRDLAYASGLALLLVAAFIVPALASLRELYAVKSGVAPFSFELAVPIARLQSGSAAGGLGRSSVLFFWAAVLGGISVLLRSRSSLALYLIAVTVAQWVGLALLAPIGLLNPIIFNRYLIGTLPLVLLLAAVGLAALAAWMGRLGRVGVPALALALLAFAGPFADPVFRRSSFQHSKDFMRFDQPRGSLDAAAVPPFYSSDDARQSGGPIVEIPFRGGWSATRTHYVYQSIHQAPVVAAEPYGWPCDGRLRLRNHVCSEPVAMLASSARFVVVHRDPLAEELRMSGGDDSGNRYRPDEWEDLGELAGRTARRLRRRWGPPFFAGDGILVWDLDVVRSRVAGDDSRPASRSPEARRARSGPRTH